MNRRQLFKLLCEVLLLSSKARQEGSLECSYKDIVNNSIDYVRLFNQGLFDDEYSRKLHHSRRLEKLRYEERKRHRICVNCGVQLEGPYVRCDKCREKSNQWWTKKKSGL